MKISADTSCKQDALMRNITCFGEASRMDQLVHIPNNRSRSLEGEPFSRNWKKKCWAYCIENNIRAVELGLEASTMA
jgi:hypothetical protein